MKNSRSFLLVGLSVALTLAASFAPVRGQEEDVEEDDGRFGTIYAELGYWVSQINGLEYFPATETPGPDPTATFLISPDDSTETAARYRVGYEIAKNTGALVLTWYGHEQPFEISRSSPGQFIYGENLAHPALAGFANDGLADAFDASGRTVLRDLRIDFYRTAFQNRRAIGKWFAGLRRVEHKRNQRADYHAVLPPFPPFLPDPGFSFDLDPFSDTAQIESEFDGRGLEAGMDVVFPFWKDKFVVEAGFAFAALRGKVDTFYLSANHFYVDTLTGIAIDPADYDTVFSDQALIDNTQHDVALEGLRTSSESRSADVQEIYLGLRWKAWRGLDVFAGFRSARYSNVGVDLRPVNVTDVVGLNFQNVTQVDRSATYEGFYGGVAYSF